jgi:hypothetical protein
MSAPYATPPLAVRPEGREFGRIEPFCGRDPNGGSWHIADLWLCSSTSSDRSKVEIQTEIAPAVLVPRWPRFSRRTHDRGYVASMSTPTSAAPTTPPLPAPRDPRLRRMANVLRALAMDAVEQAKSRHPGI